MIAIIIPTIGRVAFVARQLRYYERHGRGIAVYVGDSSPPQGATAMRAAVSAQAGLRCRYVPCPGLNERQAIVALLDAVTEPYCALSGDDDFLVPRSLGRCAAALAADPLSRTAQGRGFVFHLAGPGSVGRIEGLSEYWGRPSATQGTAKERTLGFAREYWVPLFSVHRTGEFREDCRDLATMPDRAFGELTPNFVCIARGRSTFVDCLYVARQSHPDRLLVPNVDDWTRGPDWRGARDIHVRLVAAAIAQADRLSYDVAEQIAAASLDAYLLTARGRHRNGGRGDFLLPPRIWVQKTFPRFYDWLRGVKASGSGNTTMSLGSLRRPDCPYAEDFAALEAHIDAR